MAWVAGVGPADLDAARAVLRVVAAVALARRVFALHRRDEQVPAPAVEDHLEMHTGLLEDTF